MKAGFVAIVGETNAGKSTLLNAILGKRIAIISRKVQTTRFNIRGILTTEKSQLIFVDTPGIFNPKNSRDNAMIQTAFGILNDVDAVLLMVDASKKISNNTEKLLKKISKISVPIFLALNKVDKVHPKEKLFEIAQEISNKVNFQEVFMIDALHSKGIEIIPEKITEHIPESPFLYDKDTKTDLPIELTISEMIREQIYSFVHEEIPYGIKVKTESIEETDKMEISAVIYVARESYKKIVIGNKGAKLKIIGQKSRENLEKLLDKKIRLSLFVKTNEKILSQPEI